MYFAEIAATDLSEIEITAGSRQKPAEEIG